MNAANKILLHSKFSRILLTPRRSANLWNKDWMPGPYPTTQEEREAAAKKYNLLPEEYEPIGEENGDYPKLPDISGASKDPYYNYDIVALKKDYGETMHVYENAICEERWDINHDEKQQVPAYKQVTYFLTSVFIFFGLSLYFQDKKVALPHLKKHYPVYGPQYKYP